MSINNPYVMKTKESKTIPEYKENEIDDISLSKVLSHLYKVFRVTEKKKSLFFFDSFSKYKSYLMEHFLPFLVFLKLI